MARIDWERFKEEYHLRPFGSKGWYRSKDLPCPWCGHDDKFGVRSDDGETGAFNCFHGNCPQGSGSLYFLLKEIGRNDLISYEKEIKIGSTLEGELYESDEVEESELPEETPPIGFRRIYSHPYLQSRGFTEYEFKKYEVGVTGIDPYLKNNYLIFLVRQDNKIRGWVARSLHTKEWHKKNLKWAKENDKSPTLRYKNTPGVEFDKLLFGYDEITESTKVVIVVEGIFDKIRTDQNLHLDSSDEIKCVASFGVKLSSHQINLLRRKDLEKVILFYDPETIRETQQYSLELSQYFQVEVAEVPNKEKDPGELCESEILTIFSNLKNPLEYLTTRLNSIEL